MPSTNALRNHNSTVITQAAEVCEIFKRGEERDQAEAIRLLATKAPADVVNILAQAEANPAIPLSKEVKVRILRDVVAAKQQTSEDRPPRPPAPSPAPPSPPPAPAIPTEPPQGDFAVNPDDWDRLANSFKTLAVTTQQVRATFDDYPSLVASLQARARVALAPNGTAMVARVFCILVGLSESPTNEEINTFAASIFPEYEVPTPPQGDFEVDPTE